jgi:hypothetical protein
MPSTPFCLPDKAFCAGFGKFCRLAKPLRPQGAPAGCATVPPHAPSADFVESTSRRKQRGRGGDAAPVGCRWAAPRRLPPKREIGAENGSGSGQLRMQPDFRPLPMEPDSANLPGKPGRFSDAAPGRSTGPCRATGCARTGKTTAETAAQKPAGVRSFARWARGSRVAA